VAPADGAQRKDNMIDISVLLTEYPALLVEANEQLERLVRDCCETEKSGVLTLKLTLAPMKQKNGRQLIAIDPKIESKNPKFPTATSIFHVSTDDQGLPIALTKDDPMQAKLFEGSEAWNK